MLNKSILVVLISALIIGLSWYFFPSEKVVKNVPLRSSGPILFFGDSLVEGVGATAGHDLPTLLSKRLGEPVLNYGMAGDTTRQGLTRLNGAIAEHPRLVLVLLGGNDFLQKVPRDGTFSNLEQIITGFQSTGAAVLLIGVRSGIVGGGADDRYEALAKKTKSAYVEDALRGIFGDSALMSDAIHPNDQGYEMIAVRILSELQLLLK
ncbi:MAG: GDSL-type esterase/lipase family protein [Candidatus Moraniibacteriota bacterium]